MKLGDGLEVVCAVAFTVAAYVGTHLWWVTLVAFGVVVFYLAQVYANTGSNGVPSLASLSVQSGDTVIVRIPAELPSEEFAAVQANLQKNLPENRVVVLPSTAEVGSWRPRGFEEPVASKKPRFALWGRV